MPFDEPPERSDGLFQPEPPDPERMFRAIHAHLRQAQAVAFLEFDPSENLYVVVDPSLEGAASAVAGRLAWESEMHREQHGVTGRTGVVMTSRPMREADPTQLLKVAREHLSEAGAVAAAIPSEHRDFWVAAGPTIEDVLEALLASKRKTVLNSSQG